LIKTDEKTEIISPKKFICRYCNKNYNNKNSRWSHEQKCKITKTADKDLELEKIKLEKLKEENKLIKLKIKLQNIKRLDNKTFKAVNKYLMDRSYNNNVNSNNTINNNYQILSIGNEQLKDKKK